jgi:hypothetical protein
MKKHTLTPILEEIKEALKPKALTDAEKTAEGPASAKKLTKGEDPSQKRKRKTVGQPPSENFPSMDTKEDVWVGQMAPKVQELATYLLQDDEILIEYAPDGTTIQLIENLSFNTPLTRDRTSKKEQTKKTPFPLRNIWILAAQGEEYMKTSNKAQEFAKEKATKLQKKLFEELVPRYLHDFVDIFAKDGLNKLPPSRPGIDHRINTKDGFIPKSSCAYPLSPKETEAVKAFLDEHLKKDFIQPSKSPQASGFFL